MSEKPDGFSLRWLGSLSSARRLRVTWERTKAHFDCFGEPQALAEL